MDEKPLAVTKASLLSSADEHLRPVSEAYTGPGFRRAKFSNRSCATPPKAIGPDRKRATTARAISERLMQSPMAFAA